MTNGAIVYVCGLPSDPIEEAVRELNRLGAISGGGLLQGTSIQLEYAFP